MTEIERGGSTTEFALAHHGPVRPDQLRVFSRSLRSGHLLPHHQYARAMLSATRLYPSRGLAEAQSLLLRDNRVIRTPRKAMRLLDTVSFVRLCPLNGQEASL